jgi:hypothetical protein
MQITHSIQTDAGSIGSITEYIASLDRTREVLSEEIAELQALMADIAPDGLKLRYIEGVWECDGNGVWQTGDSAREALLRWQQTILDRKTVFACLERLEMPLEEIQDSAGIELVPAQNGKHIYIQYDRYRGAR